MNCKASLNFKEIRCQIWLNEWQESNRTSMKFRDAINMTSLTRAELKCSGHPWQAMMVKRNINSFKLNNKISVDWMK